MSDPWSRRVGGWLLLLGLLGSGLGRAEPAWAAAPIPVTVQVRTAAGAGVAGLTLTLAPQPPDYGGPPAGTGVPGEAITDGQGQARVGPLAAGIWSLDVRGTVDGQPVRLDAGPSGVDGRLLLDVEPLADLETTDPGSADLGGAAPNLVGLVGQATGAGWVVEQDLTPAAAPRPLSSFPTVAVAPPLAVAAAAGAGPAATVIPAAPTPASGGVAGSGAAPAAPVVPAPQAGGAPPPPAAPPGVRPAADGPASGGGAGGGLWLLVGGVGLLGLGWGLQRRLSRRGGGR